MRDTELSESQAWLNRRLNGRLMKDLCEKSLGMCTTSSLSFPAGYKPFVKHLKGGLSSPLTEAFAAGAMHWRAIAVFCNLFEEDEFQLLATLMAAIDTMGPLAPQIIWVPHSIAPEKRLQHMTADINCSRLSDILALGLDGIVTGEPEGGRLALAIKARMKHAQSLAESAFEVKNEMYAKRNYADFLEECNHEILWEYARARLASSVPPVDSLIPRGVPYKLSAFKIGKELGRGSYGTVYELHPLEDLSSGNDPGRVVKLTLKDTIKDVADLKRMKRTIDVMRLVSSKTHSHPNIVRLLSVFHSQTHIVLVMEDGGPENLHQRLRCRSHADSEKRKDMPLNIVKSSILQMAAVMQHIHVKLCICHRDIKPENVIVMDIHNDIRLKLADFDTAFLCSQSSKCRSPCGTLPFTAPEVLSGKAYDGRQADMWSLGIVLFEMLCGVGIVNHVLTPGHPLEKTDKYLARQIREGVINKDAAGEMLSQFCLEELQPICEVMVPALKGLLDVNASDRWDASTLQSHTEPSLATHH